MEQMSVTQFAGELKMPAATLLEQLKRAGVEKSGANDLLTEQDKARLLEYLRRAHGDTEPLVKPSSKTAPTPKNRRIEITILEPGADDPLPNLSQQELEVATRWQLWHWFPRLALIMAISCPFSHLCLVLLSVRLPSCSCDIGSSS